MHLIQTILKEMHNMKALRACQPLVESLALTWNTNMRKLTLRQCWSCEGCDSGCSQQETCSPYEVAYLSEHAQWSWRPSPFSLIAVSLFLWSHRELLDWLVGSRIDPSTINEPCDERYVDPSSHPVSVDDLQANVTYIISMEGKYEDFAVSLTP